MPPVKADIRNKLEAQAAIWAQEPPFRRMAQIVLRRVRTDAATKVRYGLLWHAHYMLGVLRAAEQAQRQGLRDVSVVELGVAEGGGLLALQACARRIALEKSIRIHVHGYDPGPPAGRARAEGPYVMDEAALRPQLFANTQLVAGDLDESLHELAEYSQRAAIGFIAFDLGCGELTTQALRLLDLPATHMLSPTVLYFDDIDGDDHHQFAGDLLAIREFNDRSSFVKVDRWQRAKQYSAFPEAQWLRRMYMAHQISQPGHDSD